MCDEEAEDEEAEAEAEAEAELDQLILLFQSFAFPLS